MDENDPVIEARSAAFYILCPGCNRATDTAVQMHHVQGVPHLYIQCGHCQRFEHLCCRIGIARPVQESTNPEVA